MRRRHTVLLMLAVAGCAATPHRHHVYRGRTRHRIHHHHAVHPARRLPPGTFDQETRRRCADGDAGACRMLRAMGG